MTHKLWETHEWETATEEEVIAALFNAPRNIDPFAMASINRYHPHSKAKYLNLFYSGQIPNYIKKLHKMTP